MPPIRYIDPPIGACMPDRSLLRRGGSSTSCCTQPTATYSDFLYVATSHRDWKSLDQKPRAPTLLMLFGSTGASHGFSSPWQQAQTSIKQWADFSSVSPCRSVSRLAPLLSCPGLKVQCKCLQRVVSLHSGHSLPNAQGVRLMLTRPSRACALHTGGAEDNEMPRAHRSGHDANKH